MNNNILSHSCCMECISRKCRNGEKRYRTCYITEWLSGSRKQCEDKDNDNCSLFEPETLTITEIIEKIK